MTDEIRSSELKLQPDSSNYKDIIIAVVRKDFENWALAFRKRGTLKIPPKILQTASKAAPLAPFGGRLK